MRKGRLLQADFFRCNVEILKGGLGILGYTV